MIPDIVLSFGMYLRRASMILFSTTSFFLLYSRHLSFKYHAGSKAKYTQACIGHKIALDGEYVAVDIL